MPMVIRRCEKCFSNIFDDSEHACSQCIAGSLRTFVFATAPLPLLEIKSDGDMLHLCHVTNKMRLVSDGHQFLIPSADGMITIKREGVGYVATYAAASFKRFGIIIAAYSGAFSVMTLLFRVEVSLRHGIRFQKLDLAERLRNNEYHLPTIYQLNTAMVLAFRVNCSINFRLYANYDGVIDYSNFNGICISGLVSAFQEPEVFQFVLLLFQLA